MKTLVHASKSLCVLDISKDLPRGDHFPFSARWSPAVGAFVRGPGAYELVRNRLVSKVWIHHTGGSPSKRGFLGPLATASFVIQNPRVVGASVDPRFGRGWPGMCYHAYIPFSPVTDAKERLPVIYQCVHPDWIVWHTKGHNRAGYGVVCQGSFDLKPGTPGDAGQPSTRQLELLEAAWDEWLKPMLGLADGDLYAHADATKPTCPGGTLYDFVIGRREKRTIRKLEA
jgi:hypothetical protein